jgi:hypothetical protein
VICEPAPSTSPKNTLDMQILRPPPQTNESETLTVWLQTRVLANSPDVSDSGLNLRTTGQDHILDSELLKLDLEWNHTTGSHFKNHIAPSLFFRCVY